MSSEISYLGFKYTFELDIEPQENCKILHSAVGSDGKDIMLDFSPYERMNLETFQMIVDLKFPKRVGCGPLGKDSVMKLYIQSKI